MNRYLFRLLLTTALLFGSAGILLSIVKFNLDLSRVEVVINIVVAIAGAAMAIYSFFLFQRNAPPLVISLLGFPQSGKTVFLAVLFNELMQSRGSNIRFRPYGDETIQRVASDISTLQRRVWLPRTPKSEISFYRANAVVRPGFFGRQYKLEIADYAGELLGELVPDDDQWLHKTNFFKHAVQSDAVFIAIDCELFTAARSNERVIIQSRLVAAVQVLMENKGVESGRKMKSPLALLYLKSDLLDQAMRSSSRMENLEKICVLNCSKFRTFYISSTGTLDEDGLPPRELNPSAVVDPVLWVLNKV